MTLEVGPPTVTSWMAGSGLVEEHGGNEGQPDVQEAAPIATIPVAAMKTEIHTRHEDAPERKRARLESGNMTFLPASL